MKLSSALLPSRWLTITRLMVLAYAIYSLITLIVFLPEKYDSLRSLTPGTNPFTMFHGWTSEQIQQAADSLSVRPEVIAGVQISASLICLSFFWVMAGALFWRKSDTWTGLLAAYILFFTGPGFSALLLTVTRPTKWAQDLDLLLATITWPTFFVMLYIFPNGKFIPLFTRYLFALPYLLFLAASFNTKIDALGTGILLVYALGGLVSQAYRYRKVSTLEERQQTKWVVFAVGIVIISVFLTPLLLVIFPNWVVGSPARFWYEIIGNGLLGVLVPALLPLAIGISVLRYRLWDIDVIIRRTLVYSILTATLALVYFGLVILLEGALRALVGSSGRVATVISTLASAALFTTLRRRVQDFIDRRFYRRKYNAEQALAEFAATARAETDLEALTVQVVEIVENTLQPEHLSLWLKPDAGKISEQAQN